MNIIRNLESLLAGHLGTATGITFRAATDVAELPDKPYGIVAATVHGHKGTLYDGQANVAIHYMPTQGTDQNGSGNEIYDIGDDVMAALSDSFDTLTACNLGTAYTYMTMRFAGGAIDQEGDRGRTINVDAYWTARAKINGV